MTIRKLTPNEVVGYCRSYLGIDAGSSELDDTLLADLLRYTASIFCPCSRAVLRAALEESLSFLNPDSSNLADRINRLIEDLVVVGDFLDLSNVATDDPDVKGTWIFAAPPSFIVRRNGSIFLNGIIPDHANFLPEDLESRVNRSHATRFIQAGSDENLVERLITHGLNHMQEDVWLRSPKYYAPDQLIKRCENQLATQPICGSITGLIILDHLKTVTYYRGRWCAPTSQSGTYLARRPQEFEAPLWSVAELVDGVPTRFIDLPPMNYRWRGCDSAWHLQLAIDYCAGHPQQYLRSATDGGTRFDFFSPLPLWAQRRLMIFGNERPSHKGLFAYEVRNSEARNEEKYLREHLWLEPANS